MSIYKDLIPMHGNTKYITMTAALISSKLAGKGKCALGQGHAKTIQKVPKYTFQLASQNC